MRDHWFEWDDTKARANIRKHGVSFDLGRVAFMDTNWVDEDDPDAVELHYKRLCVFADVVYVVIYTERGDRVRIISARKANAHEQDTYLRQ